MDIDRATNIAECYSAEKIGRMIEIALAAGLSPYNTALRTLIFAYQTSPRLYG